MKKWAIYEENGCKISMRYYDDPAENEWVAKYNVPIVVNSCGGWCPASDKIQGCTFVEIVESLVNPVSFEEMYPKNSPEFNLGWISPDGDTYSCSEYDHIYLAQELVRKFHLVARDNRSGSPLSNADSILHRLGWVSITNSIRFKQRVANYSEELTKAITNKLFDLNIVLHEIY